jgi:hypothetical protein
MTAFLLALIGTLVPAPLKKVIPRFGSGVVSGVVFNAVDYSLPVAYAGAAAYLPWTILPIILLEVALLLLRHRIRFKRTVLVSSLVTGALFGGTYCPFTVYLFPWSLSL